MDLEKNHSTANAILAITQEIYGPMDKTQPVEK